ncbi:nuclear GTPase SLIP-GC isoform X2 [Scophthalmus maximus]|uniref:nuclear GTPase SLIP-GC isoform X2 n=1 Tax=Scophthalmus maximus TaxID=52904 RepID=UPI001FA8564E|nr:nuclear GTPase SLIP-GC isoform X2 [Scophthalmus maximus]
MDDFVRNKLREWGLSKWVERFKDGEVDEECFLLLDDQELVRLIPKEGPRAKLKHKLKLLKEEQNITTTTTTTTNHETVDAANQHRTQEHDETADSAEVLPSTSDANDTEEIILSDVKNIMGYVKMKLQNMDDTKLKAFLKTKIDSLETKKRELVGVFGRTGAGKSSLINAIIGEKNFFPSGSVSACTSVMIQVEANTNNSKYEADIEFITAEEWKDELWFLKSFDDGRDRHDDDVEELSVLYGDEWKHKSIENLMDKKYFKEIPEFLHSNKKMLKCDTAAELAAKIVKYTRSDSKVEEGRGMRRQYWWPLVKCVTVRVPGNSLLRHVTLVDLPGNGDCNKSRDKKWKEIVGSCSTVWIVADINRAASEKEPWEILENASGQMGNGGECQRIHFICTKSDQIDDSNVQSADDVREIVLKRNREAKNKVKAKFHKQSNIKKHFSDDCFVVYTVSSKEFLKEKKKNLSPDETEIPKLQGFLQNLNDSHSETLNYVSGAHGILSLIQGAISRAVAEKKMEVCANLEENMRRELDKVRKTMEETHLAFEKCLVGGVEKSKGSCEEKLKVILNPTRKTGSSYHRILKYAVGNNGAFHPKNGRQKNINVDLSSFLTSSIDEEFRTTFPNEAESGPYHGVINAFSLDTRSLTQKYKDVELQLTFLETEENKIKTELNKIIRERKKQIYRVLTETIEKDMQESYERAKMEKGTGSLENMRRIIRNHVLEKKSIMFDKAKENMLNGLYKLKKDILKALDVTLKESIELSLKTDDNSLPDVSAELAIVRKYYFQMKPGSDLPSV